MEGCPLIYGRCIGHGGMPIELSSKEFEKDPGKNGFEKLVFVDRRQMLKTDSYPLGMNGYSIVKLNAAELTVEYYDENGMLFFETWAADGDGGMTGKIFPSPNPRLQVEKGKTWEDSTK